MTGEAAAIDTESMGSATLTRSSGTNAVSWPLWATVCGLTALTAALSFHHLTHKGINHDEGVSVQLDELPWGDMWTILANREANGSLHTLLLREWMVFGDGLAWVRSLSVLAAVATVVVTFLLGRSLFGTRAAVFGALVLAVHPLLGEHAQNARQYALAALLGVIATDRLAAAVRRSTPARWATYSVVGALLVYAHFFGLFLLAGHALALAIAGRHLVGVRRPALAMGGIAILLVPVWLFLLTGDSNQIDWIDRLTLADYRRLAGALGGGEPLLVVGFLAAAGVALAAAVAASRAGDRRHAWALTLVLCAGAAPAVLPVAISVVEPIVVPRYLFLALPGLALTVGAGLDRLRWRTLATAALAAAVVVSAVDLWRQHAEADQTPWREIAAYVVDQAEPGDGLIVHPGSGRAAFDYHAAGEGSLSSVLQPAIPPEPWGEPRVDGTAFSRSIAADQVRAAAAPYRRVWLIADLADNAYRDDWAEVRATLDRVLGERCGSAGEREFGRLRVTLYECTSENWLGARRS